MRADLRPAAKPDEPVEADRVERALASNPLDAEEVLERFYRPQPEPRVRRDKPAHYKIVCISLYIEDIERLEAMVAELKRRGHTKASKSQVIRAALAELNLDRVPKSY